VGGLHQEVSGMTIDNRTRGCVAGLWQ